MSDHISASRIARPRIVVLKQAVSGVALCAAMAMALPMSAQAASNIETGNTYLASKLGSDVNPDFKGGTLKLDTTSAITQDFAVENFSANTIDVNGNSVTMSGAFSGAGGLAFIDNSGTGGGVILTSSANTFTGSTTIGSGASLSLSGSGVLSTSSGIINNGTFDISATSGGATIITLGGTGNVTLGAQSLTLSAAAGALNGVISGSGGLVISSGSESLSGANTYTGGTTISAGTLIVGAGGVTGSIAGNVIDNGTLSFNRVDNISFSGVVTGTGAVSQLGSGILLLGGTQGYTGSTTISAGTLTLAANGTISTSSGVTDNGIFDISTTGATIRSLAGIGTVNLGGQTLTLTAAAGKFSGTISGTGNVVVNGGVETLAGVNGWTGTTTINAGTLLVGSGTVAFNVANSGTFGFSSAGAVAMSGIISGPGGLTQQGLGTSTINVAQAYTGVTSILAGTLALAGSGSIASSSGVVLSGGALDISATAAGASITSLSGTGAIVLGTQTLTLTGATGSFAGAITGIGGLTLTSGNQTLSGANTYTGITTISGGTLLVTGANSLAGSSSVVDNAILDIAGVTSVAGDISASLKSLSGSGQVVLGGKTLNITTAAGTFSGVISGSGNVTVSGGTQTLSGVNTYTGTTTVAAGTLALSGNGSIAASSRVTVNGAFDISAAAGTVTVAALTGTGTVNLGSRTLNLGGGAGAFSGTILGAGSLALSGGTATLTGANTFTGGTTIIAGTLQIGSGSTSGSLVGDVVDNGTLGFYRSDTYVFAGAVTGLGGLAQTGRGITVLTGNSSYTGATTIAAGTLQIGNGSTSGAITGDVVDNAALVFNRSDALTFAGSISGTGSIGLASGTLVLTAVSSYTGATTVASGSTLTLSGSAAIAASSNVAVNGTLDVSALATASSLTSISGSGNVTLGSQVLTLTNASGTFAGAISGSGGLVLTGGSQTLSGINSYTGVTTVKGGTLSVTGSAAASSISVASGGTLSGTGTVGAVSVASGGTLAAGVAGSGTLTSTGNLVLASGSDYVVNLSSGTAGKFATSGSASLGGTLVVTSASGGYALGQKLTVLTASSGVTGTFGATQLQTSGATFKTAVSYDADNVYLQVDLAKLSPLLATGATANAVSAVGGIDAAIAANDTLTSGFNGLASLSSDGLGTAAGQLAGEIGAAAGGAGRALFDPFMESIFDHLAQNIGNGGSARQPIAMNAHQAWATGFAASSSADGLVADGSNDLKSKSTGFSGGADWTLSPRLSLGLAVSAGNSSFHLADDFGSGHANGIQAGFYGLAQYSSHVYGAFAGIAAMDSVRTLRTISVSGTDTLAGKATGFVIGGRYETGARFNWGTPYVALQDTLFELPAYKESATAGTAAFALDYAAHSSNLANLELGLRQNFDIPVSRSWSVRFTDRLALSETLSGGGLKTDAAFADLPDSSFSVQGAQADKSALLVALGLGLHNNHGTSFDIRFDSRSGSTSQSYTGMAGVNFTW